MRSLRVRHVFASHRMYGPCRSTFQAFLRSSFRHLLIGQPREIEALVNAITPHSFRAGMASDLHRLRVSVKVIMKTGRWHSERAMRQYVRDGLGQRLPNAKFLPLRHEASDLVALIRAHQPTVDVSVDTSDSSDHDREAE